MDVQDELVAPTVKDCQGRDVWELAEEANSLIQRARMRKLQPADYADGTFTISNLGMFGVDRFYAIITPPQSSILSVSAIARAAGRARGQDRDRHASRRSACQSTTACSTACARRSSWPRSSACSKRRASWCRMASALGASPLEVRRLGRVPYADALELQEDLRARLGRGEAPETVLLLEHPDVITLRAQREARARALRATPTCDRLGYDVFRVNRGGDVTCHGPGQLVGYPILDLARARRRRAPLPARLESALIAALAASASARGAATASPASGSTSGARSPRSASGCAAGSPCTASR